MNGCEAEELRAGIEKLISRPEYVHDKIAMVRVVDLRKLLDEVDARDSLAHLTSSTLGSAYDDAR